MSSRWKETGGTWEPDHTLLNDEQLAKCTRACDADADCPSPVPTRVVSNGEYMPPPQSEAQKKVEARINELTETASKKLGVSRRQFLGSSGGMAAAFMAMNEVHGKFFNVDKEELFEPAASYGKAPPKDLFVVDDQLHFVRQNRASNPIGAISLRAIAQGPSITQAMINAGVTPFRSNPFNPNNVGDEFGNPWGVWNPDLIGMPVTTDMFNIVNFIKSVFLDAQVTVGLISNVTAFVAGPSGSNPGTPPLNVNDARTGEILTAAQTAAARDFINELAGSRRAMAHALLYVGRGNLDYIQYQAENHRPDAWKGYNISNAAKVDSGPMQQWQHDDENVAYPTFELISKMYRAGKLSKGGNIIAVHKGLARGAPPLAHNGYPSDMPKALRDWPNLNFLTYHSCIQDTFFDDQALAEIRASEAGKRALMGGVPNIDWTTPYAIWTGPFKNSFAEIGTTFASSVVTFPTVTAHILGQLLMFKGPKQIVFGSDSLWYGSPQWQIEALWRFQIPERIRERWGYPELDEDAKRNILGRTSAKLYGLEPRSGAAYRPIPANFESRITDSLKRTLEMPPYDNTLNLTAQDDNLSKWRERYLSIGVEPSRSRYGWVRTSI
jgi:predicted TIM-barrel fold metal-dependent hydrolase